MRPNDWWRTKCFEQIGKEKHHAELTEKVTRNGSMRERQAPRKQSVPKLRNGLTNFHEFRSINTQQKLGHHEHLSPDKRLLMRTLSKSTENGARGSRKPPYWKKSHVLPSHDTKRENVQKKSCTFCSLFRVRLPGLTRGWPWGRVKRVKPKGLGSKFWPCLLPVSCHFKMAPGRFRSKRVRYGKNNYVACFEQLVFAFQTIFRGSPFG